MKEETGATPRPTRSRIDIGRSLSIGKTPSKPAETATTQSQRTSSDEQSADATKVSLSKIFEGIKIPEGSKSSEPVSQPIASGREAAKAHYLKQSISSVPTTPPPSPAAPQAAEAVSETDIGAVLQQIQDRLGQYDVSDSEPAPSGDSAETLEPYARKYVAFLEQTGQSFSSSEREAKVKEVTDFYSAPTRQGRLQSLVQDV